MEIVPRKYSLRIVFNVNVWELQTRSFFFRFQFQVHVHDLTQADYQIRVTQHNIYVSVK